MLPNHDLNIGDSVEVDCFTNSGWKIKDFISVGLNLKYKVILFHPETKEEVCLENLPYNIRKAN